MTQISYAQNFEDVVLHRSLSDVASGFYIDVGANDPRFHSVTKRFYDLGWHGINIEPSSTYFDKLCQERPRDLNLKVVVSNVNGDVRFFEFEGTGISTTEPEIAQFHNDHGYKNVEVEVETLTLSAICEKYVDTPVHFLKIDVEGGTKSVLEGLDLQAVRPWIIVIEATKPMTQIEDADEWEHLILSQNYDLVYVDGLNRFYLAFEHADRRERFKFPPNVFDDFVLSAVFDETILPQASEAAELRAVERALALEAENGRLAEVVRAQTASGQLAEATIDALRQDKAELEAALAEQVALVQGGEARNGLLEQEKAGLATALESRVAEAQAAQARLAVLEEEALALTQALAAQDMRAAAAEAALQSSQEAHIQTVAAAERDRGEFEAALAAQVALVQGGEARCALLEQEMAALTQALAVQDRRAASAEAALQSAQDAHDQAGAAAACESARLEASLGRIGERLQAAVRRAVELEKIRHDLQVELARQIERTRESDARADHLEVTLQRVAGSLSWRITAPLRGWGKGNGKGQPGA